MRSTPASSNSFHSLRSTALKPSRRADRGVEGSLAQLGAFPVDTLAIIVELRRQAEMPVLQFCNFAFQLPLTPAKARLGGVGSRGRFSAHIGRGEVRGIGVSAIGRRLAVEITSKVGFFSHLKHSRLGPSEDNSNPCACLACQSGRTTPQCLLSRIYLAPS